MVRVASVEVSLGVSGGRLVQGAAWPVQRQLSTAADITTLRGTLCHTVIVTLSYCHTVIVTLCHTVIVTLCHTVIVTLSSSCHDDTLLVA